MLEPGPRWQAGAGSFRSGLLKQVVDRADGNETARADFHRRQPLLLDKPVKRRAGYALPLARPRQRSARGALGSVWCLTFDCFLRTARPMPGRRMRSIQMRPGSRAITAPEPLGLSHAKRLRRKLRSALCCETAARKRLAYRVGHPGQCPIVDYLSRNARMRGGRIARAGRLGKFKRVWDPFPSRSPNLAAFFPPVRPISAGERCCACAAFEAPCGACFGGAADVAASLASRASRSTSACASRLTSACASRSTSAHFIVTLRYVVKSVPMTTRDFIQSTLPPSLEGISTGSLSPGRTP